MDHWDNNGTVHFEDALGLLLDQEDEGFYQCLVAGLNNPAWGQMLLFHPKVQQRCRYLQMESPAFYAGRLLPGLQSSGVYLPRFETALKQALHSMSLMPVETLTELLAADIPPPLHLFTDLMHEGMLLLGGKSKRGKSWLMFDLAISAAVGRAAWRHFDCPKAMSVLYLALEDGRARLQSRAKAIQPNLTEASGLHLRYTFPALAEVGLMRLSEEIIQHVYGLVVIDVLAKLERAGKNGEKNYHDVYEMFAPLQDLRKQQPFCLAMLTHLRKQEADDVFDTMMGSVAYQGAQDVLWVLERKPKDDFAFLHIRDKDAEDKTIALRFMNGHWEYIGEGEEYEVSRDQRRIIKVLNEEKREMTIPELMKAVDAPDTKYGYYRKLLVAMVQEDMLHRTKHGKYSATVLSSYGDEGETDVPF